MLRIVILIVALIVLRPLLVGRRHKSENASPYGNALDGMLSPMQVSEILDDFDGLRVHASQSEMAHR